MKLKTIYYSFILLLFVLLGLSACGNSKQSNDSANMATNPYDENILEETMAQEDYSYSEDLTANNSGITDTTSNPQTLPSNRKLIRNVDMTVETKAFDQLLKTLTAQFEELGGYMEQSDISGNSLNYQNQWMPRNASLVIRIPIDKLDSFITIVENNGNVINKIEITQDVTLQYSDLESRKKSLTVEQERIWALLEKADTLEAVIALEERLSEIRYQLESMESQLRLYDNQVSYSTVSLYIHEITASSAFTPVEPEGFGQRIQNGLSKNLKSISQGFTDFFVWLIVSCPFWIPLFLILIIVLLIIRRYKRTLQKHSEEQAASDSKKLDK